MGLCRRYQFEYGVQHRHAANIVVLGRRVLSIADEDRENNVIQFPGGKE